MFSAISALAGTQPFNDWFVPDTTQRHPLGTVLDAVDPYWGWGQFLYVKSNATLAKGNFCIWDDSYQATALPNTANLAFPTGVCMAGAFTAGQFGWLQIAGLAVYATTATVAADAAIGITGAGTVGAVSSGKQICGVRNRRSATATITWQANIYNTSNVILVPKGYDGAFLGMALSGTGIGAS